MKRIFLGSLVVLGTLFPVSFIPAQGSGDMGDESYRPTPQLEAVIQKVDTVVIQIVEDADPVIAEPNSVTVSAGQVVTGSATWESGR